MKLKDFTKGFTNIRDVRLYDLDESLAASGLPMMTNFSGKLNLDKESIEKVKKGRAKWLGGCQNGFGDDNFLKGILVSFSIQYPVFWSPQLQRYGFVDIVSSTSTMHRITKIDLERDCQEGVSKRTIKYCYSLIDMYNESLITLGKSEHISFIGVFDSYGELVEVHTPDTEMVTITSDMTTKIITPSDIYHLIIQNLPQGQTKWMRLTTNYLQLKTIYTQRAKHKLPEWTGFCDWCEKLPYFLEFIGANK